MPDIWNLHVSPSNVGKIYLAVCLIFSSIEKGNGLHCVQCMSLHDASCTKDPQKATLCTGADTNAQYCHKAIGNEVDGAGHIVFRTCSQIPRNNCTHEKIPFRENRHSTMFKVCHHSCSTEGCNVAAQSHLHLGAFIVILCVAVEQLLSSALK